jgi:uncharacterized protein (TIGR00299 family) protein
VRALIFDPFSGISGDMTLGALLDLGLPLEWLQHFVRELRLGEIEVDAERVDRKGIACTRLLLRLPHEHAHRHLKDVVRIIEGTGASAEVRERAVHAFTLLARAEAEVHGTTPERVHFHEVGALDAIVDVLGVAAACAELGFEAFFTRPVTLGRGWVDMAHGHFPVPPPAVLKLLNGIPVRDPDFEGECTTPTGAALLQAFTGGRAPPTTFTPLANGFGAGSRDPEDRPNCLRLIIAEGGGVRRGGTRLHGRTAGDEKGAAGGAGGGAGLAGARGGDLERALSREPLHRGALLDGAPRGAGEAGRDRRMARPADPRQALLPPGRGRARQA